MNTLSTWTFYWRHKRRAALLLSLTAMVTAALYLMVALLWAIWIEPGRTNSLYLSHFSVVMPESEAGGPDPAVIAPMRANPDVARVVPTTRIWLQLPGVFSGDSMGFWLLGLTEADLPYIVEQCGAVLKEGQLPGPRTNGLLLSEEVAAGLEVQVGDSIHESINPELFGNIVTPLEVVGILESDVRLGLVSLEFLNDHEFYRDFSTQFLVVAQPDREAAVDAYLRSEIRTPRTQVETLQTLNEVMADEYLKSLLVLIPIIAMVTIALSLVIGVANWIEYHRRLPEFGILNAVGLSKAWLLRRLTIETAALASAGWVTGIGLSWLILTILNATLFAAQGHHLSLAVLLGALALAIPVPAALIGLTLISARRILSRLDPVTIVERGQQGQESERIRKIRTSGSSPKPLASATFYSRHRRRAALLIGTMGLTILAVALTIFLLAASSDAKEPGLRYLSQVSIVRSPTMALDPGIVALIRTHPAVERVLPVAPRFHLLGISIPPFVVAEASPFAVYAEGMAFLADLYGLELKEGRLPRPYTNEMVIPETVAQNRDLALGDVIGDPDHPAYPGAEALPAEFVVSGIFARPSAPEDENWLGFVSLEFLESHEAFPVPDVPPLIVVPKAGQKDALDDWLEYELAGQGVWVTTYRQELARAQNQTRNQILQMALLESVIASVAAIALAVLNHIFISQRQPEFGVLHALGHGRPRLVWRTVQETLFATGGAWILSVVLCLLGLVYLQYGVFESLGLRLDLTNLTPWLFTLPIPIAVVAVSSGTTARTLSRLDPVSIIERRS
jgi:ABC-type lipoprotein release transport system permease subunit